MNRSVPDAAPGDWKNHPEDPMPHSTSLSAFTRRYKLAKTLRFELKPIGKTLETFRTQFLPGDERRDQAYPVVKDLLDQQHKVLLERALTSPPPLDWTALAAAHETFRTGDKSRQAKEALAAEQTRFRKALVAHFKADPSFKLLTAATPKDLFAAWKTDYESRNAPMPVELQVFLRFSCYFKGYQENRRNIYSEEPQATAAANRAVNENFPRFLENARVFRHIAENYPSILADASRELAPILGKRPLADFFAPSAYGGFLSQSRIDDFNQLLGGFVPSEGEKIRGLNEFVNLCRQQNESARADRALSLLRPLRKQILSDRETLSLVPRMFENDADLLASLRAMFADRILRLPTATGTVNLLDALQDLLATATSSDKIWLDASELPRVSKNLLGAWDALGLLMESHAETLFASERTEKKRLAAAAKWLSRPLYSLSELGALPRETDEGTTFVDVSALWRGPVAAALFDAARQAVAEVVPLLVPPQDGAPLRESRETVAKIKAALDAILAVFHFAKPLRVGEDLDRDEAFYSPLESFLDALDPFIPLYNKTRNYLTRKPGDASRVKLMFENPTLADGWDLNKEKDNTCVLFFKDGLYYLGVMNPSAKTDFSVLASPSASPCYRKMVYKLLPGPNKMLPHVFLSAKGIATYRPSPALLEKYRAGLYKKGPDFDLAFCRQLIDYFKKGIAAHPAWQTFGFRFSPTESYRGIDEFYREVADQGYRLSFENIPVETVDRLVDEGKLCLFLLWNKDFSPATNGRPNLHTLYWNALFSGENLRDVVFKLNGEAELFYRRKSVNAPFRHKIGEKMVNRRGRDGSPVPESVHGELFRHVNGDPAPLSPAAGEWLQSGNLVVKPVTHEIVKDARFAEDKFAFHVPLTINFKQPDSPPKFNDAVRAFLRDNPDANVIGIDRGERNLLYLALLDSRGNLLEQRSFNTVSRKRRDGVEVPTDYQAKLAQAERDRADARASWEEIGAIKDLKEGFLSLVVHEIAEMMVSRKAIVVLEDLNFGFKRGRFRIERQVYQKFEKALISKLNYLVFKDASLSAPGGVLQGFQLTDSFVSFERLGRQTGFLFYVPAAYTSKIDPTTGFANLFNTKKCTNAKGIQAFFAAFDSIRWDAARNAFAFDFDYRNFKTGQESHRTRWTVFSADRRLVFDKTARAEKEIFPTAIIRDALEKRGVVLQDGFDLKALLVSTEPSRENAPFFHAVFHAFERTLQMRNSRAGEDYIHSPVLNAAGEFFDSRRAPSSLPQDADANGAYHIALKGLQLLRENISSGQSDLKVEHKDWFRFAQTLAAEKFAPPGHA